MAHRSSFEVATRGRGTYDVTQLVAEAIGQSGVAVGVATVFIHHTSASLIVCENADDTVRADLERYFARLVPDGDTIYRHTDEGPDDMSAHVRTVLTQTSLQVPVWQGGLDLGTWQGLYVWEHRSAPHRRRVTVTVVG